MLQTRQAPPFRRALLAWYRAQRRDLPWRQTRDPYRIWVSEIMLQQTRVRAAVPYYERFLARFPDVNALALASERDVLAAWAGLGYYARARNLRRAAKKMLDQGGFPRDYDSILELPGIGDYTAAAVASIAFDLPHAAVDGNVLRVLSRVEAEGGDIGSAPTRARLRATAAGLLDAKRAGEFNQAMMELGATLCTPLKPACPVCPVSRFCEARKLGLERELPVKARRAAPLRAEVDFLLIEKNGTVLLWRRPNDSPRLPGFWELPERSQLPHARPGRWLGAFRHTMVNTHYAIRVFRAAIARIPAGFEWISRERLHEIPLSTAAKKACACSGIQVAR